MHAATGRVMEKTTEIGTGVLRCGENLHKVFVDHLGVPNFTNLSVRLEPNQKMIDYLERKDLWRHETLRVTLHFFTTTLHISMQGKGSIAPLSFILGLATEVRTEPGGQELADLLQKIYREQMTELHEDWVKEEDARETWPFSRPLSPDDLPKQSLPELEPPTPLETQPLLALPAPLQPSSNLAQDGTPPIMPPTTDINDTSIIESSVPRDPTPTLLESPDSPDIRLLPRPTPTDYTSRHNVYETLPGKPEKPENTRAPSCSTPFLGPKEMEDLANSFRDRVTMISPAPKQHKDLRKQDDIIQDDNILKTATELGIGVKGNMMAQVVKNLAKTTGLASIFNQVESITQVHEGEKQVIEELPGIGLAKAVFSQADGKTDDPNSILKDVMKGSATNDRVNVIEELPERAVIGLAKALLPQSDDRPTDPVGILEDVMEGGETDDSLNVEEKGKDSMLRDGRNDREVLDADDNNVDKNTDTNVMTSKQAGHSTMGDDITMPEISDKVRGNCLPTLEDKASKACAQAAYGDQVFLAPSNQHNITNNTIINNSLDFTIAGCTLLGHTAVEKGDDLDESVREIGRLPLYQAGMMRGARDVRRDMDMDGTMEDIYSDNEAEQEKRWLFTRPPVRVIVRNNFKHRFYLTYHATPLHNAKNILENGFKPSGPSHNMLGAGLYCSTDPQKTEAYGEIEFKLVAYAGRTVKIDRLDHPQRVSWARSYDTAWVPVGTLNKSGKQENCLRSVQQVKIVGISRGYELLDKETQKLTINKENTRGSSVCVSHDEIVALDQLETEFLGNDKVKNEIRSSLFDLKEEVNTINNTLEESLMRLEREIMVAVSDTGCKVEDLEERTKELLDITKEELKAIEKEREVKTEANMQKILEKMDRMMEKMGNLEEDNKRIRSDNKMIFDRIEKFEKDAISDRRQAIIAGEERQHEWTKAQNEKIIQMINKKEPLVAATVVNSPPPQSPSPPTTPPRSTSSGQTSPLPQRSPRKTRKDKTNEEIEVAPIDLRVNLEKDNVGGARKKVPLTPQADRFKQAKDKEKNGKGNEEKEKNEPAQCIYCKNWSVSTQANIRHQNKCHHRPYEGPTQNENVTLINKMWQIGYTNMNPGFQSRDKLRECFLYMAKHDIVGGIKPGYMVKNMRNELWTSRMNDFLAWLEEWDWIRLTEDERRDTSTYMVRILIKFASAIAFHMNQRLRGWRECRFCSMRVQNIRQHLQNCKQKKDQEPPPKQAEPEEATRASTAPPNVHVEQPSVPAPIGQPQMATWQQLQQQQWQLQQMQQLQQQQQLLQQQQQQQQQQSQQQQQHHPQERHIGQQQLVGVPIPSRPVATYPIPQPAYPPPLLAPFQPHFL